MKNKAKFQISVNNAPTFIHVQSKDLRQV